MAILEQNGVYTLVDSQEKISQGDIIRECPYYFQENGNYNVLNDGSIDLDSFEVKIGQFKYAMILSNSCDFDNEGKAKYMLLCPIVPLYTHLRIRRDEYYYSHREEEWDEAESGFIDRLTTYQQYKYHILPLSHIKDYDFECEPVFLDFGHIFVLRVNFVKRFVRHDINNLKRLTIYHSNILNEPSETLRHIIRRYTILINRNIGIDQ